MRRHRESAPHNIISNPNSQPSHTTMAPQTPILLLKTKSSPHDGYDDFFSQTYTPTFIPVLEHRFHAENLTHVRSLFASGAFNNTPETTPNPPTPKKYGGMIFTSQRAVEAFTEKIEEEGRTCF